MAASFSLSVVTPEKVFFDGETSQIIVRTTVGDIGILANHTSLVADLPSGPLKVKQEDGSWRVAAISTGLLKVGGNKVSILANAVEWADEIDLNWAKRSEEDARRRLKEQEDRHQLDLAELKLKRALNRISVGSGNK
ncbi:MAG: ATP synthase F1 subunit epsilon [Oscillospiraceae bacterium]|nr:ATP synthase F1 subunit epsilon [Oscillospiraceae bacterium]MDE7278660.1 ATP synthase F1 subunit epsilon [Oscillospiraceae bacterium]